MTVGEIRQALVNYPADWPLYVDTEDGFFVIRTITPWRDKQAAVADAVEARP